jgi:hypothetical protein
VIYQLDYNCEKNDRDCRKYESEYMTLHRA